MRLLFAFSILICSFFSYASDIDMSNPNTVLHSVAGKTLKRISAEKALIIKDPSYVKVIIDAELLPYFDYKYAAYVVLGQHLKKTTKPERDQFVIEFRRYLINAYAHILSEYNEQKLEIIDNPYFKNKRTVSVQVKIRNKDGNVTNVAFKLRKNKKTGEWRVFDVIAEGISMLNTKQSEFGELINRHGVGYVTELLKKKNNEVSS